MQVVAPLELNEGQEAVIRAVMVRRLTVATGPPGTGKSQLIVNAVATARAAGQTVLVASTNNKAVDEVWERCEDLAPGLLVRTGNQAAVEEELRTGAADSTRPAPPVFPGAPGRAAEPAPGAGGAAPSTRGGRRERTGTGRPRSIALLLRRGASR
ncbi:AAA domain-containing protein [Streptomyces sp. NPDC102259]|uniref:AAA domain-containing protein n=1 Tax=Streptomyces sp. NPDC102259 TaxID=3366148 RepID=UPI00380A48DD